MKYSDNGKGVWKNDVITLAQAYAGPDVLAADADPRRLAGAPLSRRTAALQPI
jgi:hypothetical protein